MPIIGKTEFNYSEHLMFMVNLTYNKLHSLLTFCSVLFLYFTSDFSVATLKM